MADGVEEAIVVVVAAAVAVDLEDFNAVLSFLSTG